MKKYIFLLAIFAMTITVKAQEINWMTMEQALDAQAKKPKKIMMDAYTKWCGPCKLLDKNTFHNPDVVKYVNDNFYAVKFDAEGTSEFNYKGENYNNPGFDASRGNGRNAQHKFSQALGINAYPSIVFFDEKGDPIVVLPGYKTPQQLELYLKMFKTDAFKSITTKEAWEKYQNDFKPEFKG
ncbi:MAG: thioredoxin family protein [Flavobacteriia bacterium]|nr:MAG: thioredoxin family protein [Flavobacteriia bacterium]